MDKYIAINFALLRHDGSVCHYGDFGLDDALHNARALVRDTGGVLYVYKLVATVRAGETPIIVERVEDDDA